LKEKKMGTICGAKKKDPHQQEQKYVVELRGDNPEVN
jgi:hypothetical protein